ncbi:PAS domain-containing protein [Streptomyces mirabilis]|uniref:PAS domain-containing protein n=1 Tax=Streptomyces mirabilis TaxID=68239 RepID=UPI003CCF0066
MPTGDVLLLLDESGRVIEWGRPAEELFGWSAEEAVGQSVTALMRELAADGKHRGKLLGCGRGAGQAGVAGYFRGVADARSGGHHVGAGRGDLEGCVHPFPGGTARPRQSAARGPHEHRHRRDA